MQRVFTQELSKAVRNKNISQGPRENGSPAASPPGTPIARTNERAQVAHDTHPPAESAAGDHGAEPQTTSTGSTDSPGADPKTGGGTAAPNQDAHEPVKWCGWSTGKTTLPRRFTSSCNRDMDTMCVRMHITNAENTQTEIDIWFPTDNALP